MDRQDFISYINAPEKLGKNTLSEIEKLSRDYPYCQSLRILHLLNLHAIRDVKYGEQLKSTAAYIADRKRLKELISSLKTEERDTKNKERETSDQKPETSDQIPVTSDQKPETSDQKPETSDQIPVTSDQKPVTSDQLQETSTHIPPKAKEPIVPAVEETEEERLQRLKEIVENRLKEIAAEKGATPVEEKPESLTNAEIIDKFIEEEPSISRPKADFFDPVKVAKSSQQEQDGLVSETLANIHVQQGNIAKAIEIYRKLSLNFPEKSSYFAAQIEKISTEN